MKQKVTDFSQNADHCSYDGVLQELTIKEGNRQYIIYSMSNDICTYTHLSVLIYKIIYVYEHRTFEIFSLSYMCERI